MSERAQLTLPVHLRDEASLDNFLFTRRLAPLQSALRALCGEQGEPSLFLYGGAGSGRSHLLQAACHQFADGTAWYLPLEQLQNRAAAAVLADTEQMALLSLDNIDAVLGRPDWEDALFHLINRARGTACRLLFSAAVTPLRLSVKLPDLASRLSGSVVFQLPDYRDEEKLQVLQFRAGRRGMHLDDEAGRYILSRAPRSFSELMAVLETLEQASLVAQRKLSVHFIKQTLGW